MSFKRSELLGPDQVDMLQKFFSCLEPVRPLDHFRPNDDHQTIKLSLQRYGLTYQSKPVRSLKFYINTEYDFNRYYFPRKGWALYLLDSLFEVKFADTDASIGFYHYKSDSSSLAQSSDIEDPLFCYVYTQILLKYGMHNNVFMNRALMVERWDHSATEDIYNSVINNEYNSAIYPAIATILQDTLPNLTNDGRLLLISAGCGSAMDLVTCAKLLAPQLSELYLGGFDLNQRNVKLAQENLDHQVGDVKSSLLCVDVLNSQKAVEDIRKELGLDDTIATVMVFSGLLSRQVLTERDAVIAMQQALICAQQLVVSNFS